jgi:putative transposase
MPNYTRAWCPGGTWFFTLNLAHRRDNDLLIRHIDPPREAVSRVRLERPFHIHAWVVLPDHMHCVIELPDGDSDFATRWRLIKSGFSRQLPAGETRSTSRLRRTERGIWQRRFWEHQVRDERDYRAHVDYVHINPVRHGLVGRVVDWPYSTFGRLVARGLYPEDWGGGVLAGGLGYGD